MKKEGKVVLKKIFVAVLALTFITACGTPNNNNNQTPNDAPINDNMDQNDMNQNEDVNYRNNNDRNNMNNDMNNDNLNRNQFNDDLGPNDRNGERSNDMVR